MPKTLKIILLYIFLFTGTLTHFSFAQEFKRFDYLPVIANGNTLRYPWTGGVNSVQFGKADVNRDGLKDLVVYDKSNSKYLIFLALSNNSTDYKFDNNYSSYFPPIDGWIIMKDYNCDGIEDVFTYNGAGNTKVYKGYYVNDTLHYSLQQDGFFYEAISGKISVYCSEVIKPAIADINNDGDLDILSFNVIGNRLIYYENQKTELNLSCDSLFFTKSDNCWGNIEDTFSASYSLRDTCSFKFNRLIGNEQILHVGSSVEAFDVDANGAVDIVIGSIGLNNLTMLYNDGTSNYASILREDVNYPSENISFNTNSFGIPAFIDVDNDDKTDLLVSTFDEGAANINNIWYYKNQRGIRFKPRLQQKNFLLDNMIDAGENSNPCFADVDGDGLTDILLGSSGFRDNINPVVSKLLFYKNTGTATQPAFSLTNDNFLDIASLNAKDLVPAAGDLDNDGDIDLLVGISDGRMLYWENNAPVGGTPNYLYKAILKDASNNNISIGTSAAPFLIDIDRDGKTDLIIGERNGNLNFYRGHSDNSISLTYVTDSLGKVRIKTNTFSIGYTHPCIYDVNGDEKYDLVLGTNFSGLQFYDNIEDKVNSGFTLSSLVVSDNLGARTTSTLADITNDGKPELLTGSIDGGLIIFSKDPPPFTPTSVKNNLTRIDFDVYPNPANKQLFIEQNSLKKDIRLQLFNIVGQELIHKQYYNQEFIALDIHTIPSGLYLLKISDAEKEGFQKIVIQK